MKKTAVAIGIALAIVCGIVLAFTMPASGQIKGHTTGRNAPTQPHRREIWQPNPKYAKATRDTNAKTSVQCWGTVYDKKTKQDRQCKLHGTPNFWGKYYCHWHIDQAPIH